MDKNYLVTKSNKLVTCGYDLSLQEQKIILTLASMVQPHDTEFKQYEFRIKDFMNILGIKDKHTYKEVRKITKELKEKVFEIAEGTDMIQVSWLGGVRYKTKEGIVLLRLDEDLKPYMLGLKELYTSYKLENVLKLKSKYSIRIYEILKSNLFKKTIDIDLDDFKNMVGAKDKAYDIYQNVKNRILVQAKKELETLTDISFNYEEIKTGRKVTSIKFIIRSTKVKCINTLPNITTSDEIVVDIDEKPLNIIEKDIQEIMNITNNEFGEQTVMLFRELSKGDMSLIQKVYDYMGTRNVNDNRTGYMRTLLTDFQEPKASTGVGTTKFNNFEPRKKSERYAYLEEQCLLGQATTEERREFDEMRNQ